MLLLEEKQDFNFMASKAAHWSLIPAYKHKRRKTIKVACAVYGVSRAGGRKSRKEIGGKRVSRAELKKGSGHGLAGARSARVRKRERSKKEGDNVKMSV